MSDKPNQPNNPERPGKGGVDVIERPGTVTKETIAEPPQWFAMLINDPVTPFQFVVIMLTTVFGKSKDEAAVIMMDTHENGRAAIMNSIEDVVRTKVDEANAFSSHHGFVLDCQAQKS